MKLLEMKNAMSEMKNSLGGINRLGTAKKSNEVEDVATEII